MEFDNFHNGALFYIKELFAFGPSVFQGVGKELPLIIGHEINVLIVEVLLDGIFYGGVLTVIKEEIVVGVFLVYPFSEKLIYLLQIGQSVYERHLVLFRIVVDFVVVHLVVILYAAVYVRLAFDQKIGQNIFLLDLFVMHRSKNDKFICSRPLNVCLSIYEYFMKSGKLF